MDLLKTILLYMSLTFAASVQTAPDAADVLRTTPEPTPYVQAATPTPVPTPAPTPVPTIDITPNPAYKTLSVGDRGANVRQMQEKLIEYGYLTGEADGAYGNQTRRAVEAFQYQHGLSADGIAGRRTLTVLFESDEIRKPAGETATAAPTEMAQLTVAITPTPTVQPAPTPEAETVPSDTPAPTAQMTAKPSATPTATAEPAFVAMEGYQLLVGETLLEALPYQRGDDLYVPVSEVLGAGGCNVIASSSVEQEEFAFAIADNLIRMAYSQNRQGEPEDLEVYVNGEPQLVPNRDVRRVGDIVYLPFSTLERYAKITSAVNESAKQITLTMPPMDNE